MTRHSTREIASELAGLGVRRGNTLMVHASLRRLGPIEGGADGVLDAIQLALGPTGNILMMIAADDDEPFDRFSTPADPDNGVLAEIFRQRSDVEVNDHPACRFAGWGRLTPGLLNPQPLHDYYGIGSPLHRFKQVGGRILRLGADPDTVTLTHLAENLAEVPDKVIVEREYERAETGCVLVRSIDDSEGIAKWSGGDYFPQILLDFLEEGLGSSGTVGDCQAELLDANRFVDFAVGWIERELTKSPSPRPLSSPPRSAARSH